MIHLPGRRVRYALLVAGSAAALLLAAPAAPASAAPKAVDLNCTITITVDIHPGTTTELRHITADTQGFTGVATCTGTVNGEPVTGTGRYLVNTHALSSCTQTTASSNFVLKIPTASGTQTIPGRFTTTSPPTVLSGDLTGVSVTISRVGDCFTTPLTGLTAVQTVHIVI
jgi:hypothetical protein